MKQNDIEELSKLDLTNYENIFNVYQTNDNLYFYNLNTKLVFPQNLPKTFFTNYTIVYEDTWPLISYKNFNTPNLWWLIAIANNIQNPIEKLIPGTNLKIPIERILIEVLNTISK
jgi:LysM repeat protein